MNRQTSRQIMMRPHHNLSRQVHDHEPSENASASRSAPASWRFRPVGDVRSGSAPQKCDVLREGMCWAGEGSTALASELFTDADKPAIVPHLTASDVEHRVLDLVPEVWDRMLAKLDSLRETALAAHAALPKQCHHCKGSGLLPPPA